MKKLSTVRVGETESVESAIKRFKRKCQKDGIIGDIRKKEAELSNAMQSLLQIKAKITLVAPKTIQRSEGKAKRVIDTRNLIDNK